MDSIADLIVRIKNGLKVNKEQVEIPHSKMKEALVKLFVAEGYLSKYEVLGRANKKLLRVALKYTASRQSVINDIKRRSRSSCRVYVGKEAIPRVQAGYGTAILSTSQGLMTDADARAKKLGGEVICYIW